MAEAQTIRLTDYKKPAFTCDKVELDFSIGSTAATAEEQAEYKTDKMFTADVVSRVTYQRAAEGAGIAELVLDTNNPNPKGEPDYITQVTVNGWELAEGAGYTYDRENNKLIIPVDPSQDNVDVEIHTHLQVTKNTNGLGLYDSNSVVVSQGESEGFRRITPFTDRPDIMSVYTVRVEADKADFPILLANGNRIAGGETGDRHWAQFTDPNPKPCYLFATANGIADIIRDSYVTATHGRPVQLQSVGSTGNPEDTRHALNGLKRFLQWDEATFGPIAEYDLDIFTIWGISKFNFGAMENTSLNIFRDSALLANPDMATDDDYLNITRIVGHEAAHKKSGNDTTLSQWMYISMKEGLTVKREQMFMASVTSEDIERIKQVLMLRAGQFMEDDSPSAHAVIPDEVASIINCYSGTIYQKGAEIITMMELLMGGREKLVEGIAHFLTKHKGQAVTTDDLVKAMEEVSGLDLGPGSQFYKWYKQAGRPRVTAQGEYDAAAKTYTLTLTQQTPASKAVPNPEALYIPVKLGLVDKNGNDMPLTLDTDGCFTADAGKTERVIALTEDKQTFVFTGVQQEPAYHSLFRHFSAPVDIDPGLSTAQLRQQLLTDSDSFNRWEASQKLAMTEMKRLYAEYTATGALPAVDPDYVETVRGLLNDKKTDPYILAMTLALPDVKQLEVALKPVDTAAISAVMGHLRKTLGRELAVELDSAFYDNDTTGRPYSPDIHDISLRKMKAVAVSYEAAGSPWLESSWGNLYRLADNLTDRMIYMSALKNSPSLERQNVFEDFYNDNKDNLLVLEKWLALQAQSDFDGIIPELKTISALPFFDWSRPGHAQTFLRAFAANYGQFHRQDGQGYEFFADGVLKVCMKNPEVSATLIAPLCRWRDYTGVNRDLMLAQLERVGREAERIEKDLGLDLRDIKDKIRRALPDAEERKTLSLPAPAP